MTTARRDALRRIMAEAWGWFRTVGGDFAEALRMAWKAHKMRTCGPLKYRRVKPYVRPVLSPLEAGPYLAGRYAARKSRWYGARVCG